MRSIAKAAKNSGLVISALMCALGILLIIIPGFFAEVIGIVLGIAVLVFGCSRLFAYFSGNPFRIALRADLAFGIMLIALGIIFLSHPRRRSLQAPDCDPVQKAGLQEMVADSRPRDTHGYPRIRADV